MWGGIEGIGKDDHERAAVELFGNEVERWCDRGGVQGACVGTDGGKQLVEQRDEVVAMEGVGAAGSLMVVVVGEEGEAGGIVLAVEEVDKHSGCVGTESEFVWMGYIILPFDGEEHRGALVDEELAAEVGFFFKLLDIKAVGTAIEAPIDMGGAFAGVVLAIVGKFYRKAVQRTAVAARDKAFHGLPCEEVELAIALGGGGVHKVGTTEKNAVASVSDAAGRE